MCVCVCVSLSTPIRVERLGVVALPGGKIEICATTGRAQETVMAAMQREIAEELVFRTRKGKPFIPCLDEPVATVHLPVSAHVPTIAPVVGAVTTGAGTRDLPLWEVASAQ